MAASSFLLPAAAAAEYRPMQIDLGEVSRIRPHDHNPHRNAPVDAVTSSLIEFG